MNFAILQPGAQFCEDQTCYVWTPDSSHILNTDQCVGYEIYSADVRAASVLCVYNWWQVLPRIAYNSRAALSFKWINYNSPFFLYYKVDH